MAFLKHFHTALHQLVHSKKKVSLNDIQTSITCLLSEWNENNDEQKQKTNINSAQLRDIITNIHILCIKCHELNTSTNGMYTLETCIKQLISSLFQRTLHCFDALSSSSSIIFYKWIKIIGYQMKHSLKHDQNNMDIMWRLLICKEIVSLIHSNKNSAIVLKFTEKVEIINYTMKVLNAYDIQRIYSFMYYGELLWRHDYNYVHPKCDASDHNAFDIYKCKPFCASFNFVLFYVSLFFIDLLKLFFNDKQMNEMIFMDLSNEYLLYKKLEKSQHGFTIEMQRKMQQLILCYIRYCLSFEILTTSKFIDRGQNIEINLHKKIAIKKLLLKHYEIDNESFDLIATQIKKSKYEIMDYFNCNENEQKNSNEYDGIYFYVKHLAPIWKKELFECHKIESNKNKNNNKQLQKRQTEWDYYRKYASKNSNKYTEKEEQQENQMGDCWEYLFFMTRFEILYVFNKHANKANKHVIHALNNNFRDILYAMFRILRSYRDYHKIFALKLISTMMDNVDILRCKAVHKHAAVLLDSLRTILAFREDAISQILYPLIMRIMCNPQIVSVADQIEIYQNKYYNAYEEQQSTQKMQQNILVMNSLEDIYRRINSDSNTLIHSVGKADVLRKRMIINYYLNQLKYEKVLNIKRWNVVFDIVLEFMINSDDLQIVEICFEYIHVAIMECWMNIFSYHGKIILYIAKLCLKLDKYECEDRSYYETYDLIKDKHAVFDLCQQTLLWLLLVFKSEKQINSIKSKLMKIKSIPALSGLIDNVLIAYNQQIQSIQRI